MEARKEAVDPEPGKPGVSRPRGPAILAAAFVAAAFLAALGIPAACDPGGTAPASSRGGPAGLYSVHTERLRDPAAAELSRMIPARVVRVVDGDTVMVEIPAPRAGLARRETVRLIGVDAPELARAGRPSDPGGPESAQAARRLMEGREVLLAFDREPRDRYGRVLAYLYAQDGVCLNLHLVESGAAKALLRYPFAFSAVFEAVELDARAARRGLWAVF